MRRAFWFFWLCAAVTPGCVGTTLETPKNHPADPNAPIPARKRPASVLNAEPKSGADAQTPTANPHAHMHRGGM